MFTTSNPRRFTVLTALTLIALLVGTIPAGAQDGDGDTADPLGGASEFAQADERTAVTLILDWTPNTNHTGLYAAQARGYYDDANLDVTIQEPTDLLPEAIVGSGTAEFGVSFQEVLSFALADGQPLVSVAAIVQHNTSAFVTIAADHPLQRPADMAGLTYGGFGQPDLETAIIDTLLACDGADPGTVTYLDVGFVDLVALMEQERIDLAWIFYGVQGIQAEQRGVELDTLLLADYLDCVPDYYTPLLITHEDMVDEQPDVVAAFVQATARGYAYTIANPDEAAELLLDAVPELDADTTRAGVNWFAPRYQDDAPRWGQQSPAVWQNFTDFLVENGILAEPIDTDAAFTNEFLPGSVPPTDTDEAE